MSLSNRILSIYKSRKTIFELLDHLDYETSEYDNFSINEIDAMFANSQLDVLLSNTSNDKKVYVKYYIDETSPKQIKPSNLDDIIEDLYNTELVLSKKDTLIVIIDDKPNETILTKIKYLYDHNGIFVIIFNIKQLQFNILNHSLNPKRIRVLEEKEMTDFKQTYHINHSNQLPEISRFDPLAMALLLRPNEIIEIIRDSVTSLEYKYFRICV
jgi:DNA-directed RNA polymerase subunit H (RpoH/RPB5)